MNIQGYAAFKAKTALKPFAYKNDRLGDFEVLVKITHCGICHSDVHLIDNDWGNSKYPFIPGHEIIGSVDAIGSSVKHLKKGQRVGIGWQASSCLACEWCISGEENSCAQNQATCVHHHGGFAQYVIVDSRFAFAIPDALESESTAPLLCAGITVFTPFVRYVSPTMKVGIIGIGGLGHLALQFARAWGCEVTAFSGSPEKKKEAQNFGAHEFVLSSNAAQMKKAVGSIDILLSVVSADIDWPSYLNILRPHGKIIVLGASPTPIQVPAGVLISGQKSLVGSNIGSRGVITQMLDFAARHKIHAQTQMLPLKEVNTALGLVRQNQARYRMVLNCSKV